MPVIYMHAWDANCVVLGFPTAPFFSFSRKSKSRTVNITVYLRNLPCPPGEPRWGHGGGGVEIPDRRYAPRIDLLVRLVLKVDSYITRLDKT